MTTLYLLLTITCFIQVAFYGAIFYKVVTAPVGRPKLRIESCKPVSVVICARNEARNLKKYLPVILEQDYPAYEVIVVDDGSLDNTPKVLSRLENRYPHLLSFRIEPEDKQHPGKKQALQHGISLSKFDWILVTDGDCCPISNRWIGQMVRPLAEEADIVLGVSPFFRSPHPWNTFFRAEAIFIAMIYTSFALSGIPFMGVGRNMAYRRSVFERHDLEQHWDLLSGDDDLFINDVADSSRVAVCLDHDAFTYSEAPLTPAKWFRQKQRHYTTGYRYNLLQKIWLGYYWMSSLLLYLLLPALIVLLALGRPVSIFLVSVLAITALIRWGVIYRSFRKLGQHIMSWSVPILDLAYILSVWVISPISGIGRKRWK